MKNLGFVILAPDTYFDMKRGLIVAKEKETILTGQEFKVLSLLTDKEGILLPHDEIIEKVWNEKEHQETIRQSLSNIISRLKKKEASLKDHIKIVKGVGYKFERDKIQEIKELFLKEPHTFQERKDIFEKFLNGAVQKRIKQVSDDIDELYGTIRLIDKDASEMVKAHYQERLHHALLEYQVLNGQLYSDRDLVLMVNETESVYISSCDELKMAVKELEERLLLLQELEKTICK